MLSLKLQRRIRQESYESEIPIGEGTTDVDISVSISRRVIIVKVHNEVFIGGVRATILDLSAPVASRGRGVGRDYSIGMM